MFGNGMNAKEFVAAFRKIGLNVQIEPEWLLVMLPDGKVDRYRMLPYPDGTFEHGCITMLGCYYRIPGFY